MSVQLTRPVIVPEYSNAIVKAYIPDPVTGFAKTALPRYTINVQAVLTSLIPGRIARPNTCALLGNDLFISNSSSNSQCIFKLPSYLIQPEQAVKEAFIFTRRGSDYVGMAFDAAGELYAAEGSFGNNNIVKYTGTNSPYPGAMEAPAPNLVTKNATPLDLGNAGKTSYFANPVFDSAGNLWASDYQNHRIVVIKKADLGTVNAPYRELANLTAIGSIPVANNFPALKANASHLFAEPEGLDFDAAGNLWVANNNDGGASGVQNTRTSLVKLTPALLAKVLATAAGGTITPVVAQSNTEFFIYQVPNINNDGGGRPQFGGLQIDREAGHIFVNEQIKGNGRGYDIGTIAAIGTATGVNDLDIVSTNPGNGGLALVRTKASILVIRDTVNDTGAEPDTTTTRPWESPDIWPRQTADGSLTGAGSMVGPIKGSSSGVNAEAHVYVRITNMGLTPSDGSEELRLYWARASAGNLSIPQPWNGDGSRTANGGKVNADQPVPVIKAGASQLVHFVWAATPTPGSKSLGDRGHFCLLGQITDPSVAEFEGGFHSSTTQAMLNADVLALRTVAWVNIHIADASTNLAADRPVEFGALVVANYTREPMLAQVAFEVLNAAGKLLDHPAGRLLISPEGLAIERLREYREHVFLEEEEHGEFRHLNLETGIPQLRVEPGELLHFALTYVPDHDVKGFAVRAIQYNLNGNTRRLVGGQTFVAGKVAGFTVPHVRHKASPVISPFDSYTLSYRSGHPTLDARIYCWRGNTRVGTIDFRKEGSSLPANFYDGQPGGWGVYIYHPLSRFNDVTTILRYEKPLHLYFTPDTLDAGIITSDHEPIGEQEYAG